MHLPPPMFTRSDTRFPYTALSPSAKPGASKSAILADAVAAWFNRRGSHELDDRFGLRLNRISTQLNRIERDGKVLLRSEEHTSELQSLMRITYAAFCLKKNKTECS